MSILRDALQSTGRKLESFLDKCATNNNQQNEENKNNICVCYENQEQRG